MTMISTQRAAAKLYPPLHGTSAAVKLFGIEERKPVLRTAP